MSHFTVLVIGEEIDAQLEPFWELDLYPEEAKNDPRSEFNREYMLDDAEKEWKEYNNENPDSFYESTDEFMADYHGYIKNGDSYGYYNNPNAKWDWYTVGGRWTGTFKVKENPKYPNDVQSGSPGLMTKSAKSGFCDSIRLCDIDFDGMKEESKIDNEKYWNEAFEKYPGEDKVDMRKLVYGISEGQTKEEYINKSNGFSAYAVLKDGEWNEKGSMGWFGISIDEKDDWNDRFDKLIKELPQDSILTMVDCHI